MIRRELGAPAELSVILYPIPNLGRIKQMRLYVPPEDRKKAHQIVEEASRSG